MKSIILLFLLASPAFAEYKLNPYTNQKDFYESTTEVKRSTGALAIRVTALELSGGVGGSTIAVNASQFTGNGAEANPLNLVTSSVTLQGNTFNDVSKLLKLDANAKIAQTMLPAIPPALVDLSTVTTALSGKVSKTGDTMSGQLTVQSSVTITGSSGGYGLSVSSNVYIVGFSSAAKYYGDGSALTGINTGTTISTNTIDALPIGTILPYGSTTTIPSSYLLCGAIDYSTTTYSALFSVIGYKFGGSGASFRCDVRGRAFIGMDNLGGTSANVVTDANADILGGTGGNEFVTLTAAQSGLPDHTHAYNFKGPTTGGALGGGDPNSVGTQALNTGGVNGGGQNASQAHSVMQPWLAMAYIIKYRTALDVVYTTNTVGPLVTSSSTYSGQNTFSNSVTVSSLTATSTITYSVGIVPLSIKSITTGTGIYYSTNSTGTLPRMLWVRMVAGGGGGQGISNGVGYPAGGTGGDTQFGSVYAKGAVGQAGGNGGTGTATLRFPGTTGSSAGSAVAYSMPGQAGAASPFGGGGGGGGTASAGAAAPANSGAGGGGAGGNTAWGSVSCYGGGSGEYVEILIPNPSASYSYAVGAAGTGGAGASAAGGNGGSGRIIVYEYY